MKDNPLFTILTCSSNCLPYIGQCVRSVMAQTHKNWEMIIGDDASNDGTYRRACEIAAKQDNIQVVRNEKKLYCGANYANILTKAKGKYIGIVDGDDILEPNAMETVIKHYQAYPKIDFIWTKHKWGNTNLDRFRGGLSRSACDGTIWDSENKLRHIYSHWRTFKTEMRERGQLFRELKWTVDKDLGYTLEELGHGGFLGIELYRYRYHKANMSHNSSQRMAWREIRKYHKKKPRNKSIKLKIVK